MKRFTLTIVTDTGEVVEWHYDTLAEAEEDIYHIVFGTSFTIEEN